MRAGLCVAVAVALLACPSMARADDHCAGAGAKLTERNAGKVRKAVVCLVNRERAKAGLGPLAREKRLTRAATRHSRDMVAKGYFHHDAPDGSTMVSRIQATGYLEDVHRWTVGENIACGTTAAAVMEQWMDSASHRINVLGPILRDAGVGIAPGTPTGRPGATFTLNVGVAR